MMARNNRERVKIEHRRSRVINLYLKGWTQVDIALELSVSQATVSNDIKACRQEWKEQRIRDTDAVIDEESRRLLMVLREALSGWEASKQPVETTKVSQLGDRRKVEKVVRQRSGDSRFLKVALDALLKRCELLGIDPATLAKRNSSDSKKSPMSWDALFEAQRKRTDPMVAIEKRIADAKNGKA